MWRSVCQGTGGGVSLGRYGHLTYFQRQLRVSRGLYITGAAREDAMSREQQPSRWSRKMSTGMRSRICVCSEAYLCVEQEEQGKSPGCLEHSEAPSPPPVHLCLLSLPCPTDLSGSHAACRECSRHCPSALRLHRIVSLDLSTLGSMKSLSVLWVSLPVALNVPCVPQS